MIIFCQNFLAFILMNRKHVHIWLHTRNAAQEHWLLYGQKLSFEIADVHDFSPESSLLLCL